MKVNNLKIDRRISQIQDELGERLSLDIEYIHSYFKKFGAGEKQRLESYERALSYKESR